MTDTSDIDHITVYRNMPPDLADRAVFSASRHVEMSPELDAHAPQVLPLLSAACALEVIKQLDVLDLDDMVEFHPPIVTVSVTTWRES